MQRVAGLVRAAGRLGRWRAHATRPATVLLLLAVVVPATLVAYLDATDRAELEAYRTAAAAARVEARSPTDGHGAVRASQARVTIPLIELVDDAALPVPPDDLAPVSEPFYDTDVADHDLHLAARLLGLSGLGVNLDRSTADHLVADARHRLEPVLWSAGVPIGEVAGVDAVEAAARRLQVGWDGEVEARVTDTDGVRALARALDDAADNHVRTASLLLGHDPGGRVDAEDVRAVVALLGHAIEGPPRPDHLRKLHTVARSRVVEAVWATGHDPGWAVTGGDLRAFAARLGVDVADRLGAADVARVLDAARRSIQRIGASEVAPGVTLTRWRANLGGTSAVAHVLHWDTADPSVVLRTQPLGGLRDRIDVPTAVRVHAEHGAVAGVNGGFWTSQGLPDGLLVTGGQLLSEPTWVRSPRGAFAVLDGGELAIGRPGWRATVSAPDGSPLTVRGVNRPIAAAGDVVVYTPGWGAATGTAPGTVEVTLDGVRLGSEASGDIPVASVSVAGNSVIPRGGVVVSARGAYAPVLASLAAGGRVDLRARLHPEGWDAAEAIAGGPVLLAANQATTPLHWRGEGFDALHTDRRHPRTAVGVTAHGQGMLVAIDGRRPGHSAGMTAAETARFMRALGATDALMLDGGGSTQMALPGGLVNVPCCDAGPRPVSTAVMLYVR